MTQEQLNERETTSAKSKSLEVPSHKIDDFDETLDKEVARTNAATADAEYNRKKYAQAKDRIRELEEERRENLPTIEDKNALIAKLRRADRTARDNTVAENRQELAMLNFVADRMLRNKRA